jgi:ABC-2 type transport system permease protein
MINHLKVVYARAYVRLKGLIREPHWSIAEVIIPLLSISAYIYLYQFINAPHYLLGFVVIGGAMLAFWSNILWGMSTQLYWEKETGTLTQYMIAPISRIAILIGMAIGGMINTSIRALSILGLSILLFPIQLSLADPFALLLIFALSLIALYGMGMLFASLFLLYGREASHIADLLQEPIYLLSGLYYPIFTNRFIPNILKIASTLIPLTLSIDGIRILLILNGTLKDIFIHIIGLSILSLILIPLARIMLNRLEYISKKEGRLILRWQ